MQLEQIKARGPANLSVTIGFVRLQVISNTHDWGVDLNTAESLLLAFLQALLL
jgi:hypothetical protein